jgi:hypothetical protein
MSDLNQLESEQEAKEQKQEGEALRLHPGEIGLPPKLVGVLQSRKVWAGVMGLATTLLLWWLGEIDGTRAVEALTWVLGIFIGSVAFEDGMTRLFSTLAQAVATEDQSGVAATRSGKGQKQKDMRW